MENNRQQYIEVETNSGKKTIATNHITLVEESPFDSNTETRIYISNGQAYIIKEKYDDFMKRFNKSKFST